MFPKPFVFRVQLWGLGWARKGGQGDCEASSVGARVLGEEEKEFPFPGALAGDCTVALRGSLPSRGKSKLLEEVV